VVSRQGPPDIDAVCTMTGLGRHAQQRGKTRADRRAQRRAVGGEGGRDTWRGAQDVLGRGRPGEGAASDGARADAEAAAWRGRGSTCRCASV
jgi:hypothetical protein